MPLVRTSGPAMMRALLVIAVPHAVAILLHIAINRLPFAAIVIVWTVVLPVVLEGLLLFACHLLMRLFRVSHPWGYAATAVGLHALMLPVVTSQFLLLPIFPFNGRLVGGAFVLALAAVAATVYARSAGTEISDNASTLQTADGYDLPVQVRTSKLAFLIVVGTPAVVITVITGFFMMFGSGVFHGERPSSFEGWIRILGVPAYASVLSLILTALPALVVVGVTHVIARALRRVNRTDYAAIGACISLLGGCTLTMYLLPLFVLPLSALSGAIMAGSYRKLAGLEPVPVAEVVQVSDPVTLVDADHFSRRMRAVVGK